MSDENWIAAASRLRAAREPAVLMTVVNVRGHAPRDAGAKMLVSRTNAFGSIGGGNVEAVAVERARELLESTGAVPELHTSKLSDKAPYQHGVQCCGGEVTVLLDPLPVVPAVAIFGFGHVGFELARILARHDIELHVIDTRAEQFSDERLALLTGSAAQVHTHHLPVLPEVALGELPEGTHVLVMTHDHAEDAALCDAMLREGQFGSIGLIGSASKWARFQRRLAEEGGHEAETISRIKTPIGLPDLTGKDPATIAVSVAADLLRAFERERAGTSAEAQ